ncbi:MAG: hypothetical protein DMF96_30440 [Acidobacteria bacterium]|nr:MAG: hypothetical protein DMF96_30440 [Acidobacteriota bacterium]
MSPVPPIMNAGRFQIAVHDAGFVRRLEAARARRADRQSATRRPKSSNRPHKRAPRTTFSD